MQPRALELREAWRLRSPRGSQRRGLRREVGPSALLPRCPRSKSHFSPSLLQVPHSAQRHGRGRGTVWQVEVRRAAVTAPGGQRQPGEIGARGPGLPGSRSAAGARPRTLKVLWTGKHAPSHAQCGGWAGGSRPLQTRRPLPPAQASQAARPGLPQPVQGLRGGSRHLVDRDKAPASFGSQAPSLLPPPSPLPSPSSLVQSVQSVRNVLTQRSSTLGQGEANVLTPLDTPGRRSRSPAREGNTLPRCRPHLPRRVSGHYFLGRVTSTPAGLWGAGFSHIFFKKQKYAIFTARCLHVQTTRRLQASVPPPDWDLGLPPAATRPWSGPSSGCAGTVPLS